ncbi:MAG: 2-isopropylmalate synthase, partial [Oscillospiraceae bacterium]|nr:2-isopropylmalate synthase [Oscillospiraceae bacterium]
IDYIFDSYTEHDLEGKSSSKASSYVSIKNDGKSYYGAGIDSDIIVSSVKALVSAVNIMLLKK